MDRVDVSGLAGTAKMKILIALSSLHSGGAERVACTLADAWTARGDTVILLATFSGRGQCFYQLSENVRVVYLADLAGSRKKSFINQLQRLLAYRRLLQSERPDVIVSFLPGVNVASILASRGLGIPVIACERTDPVAWPMPVWKKQLYAQAYRHADMLTVQTDSVARRVPTIFPVLKNLQVVPNPIPASLQNYQPSRPPQQTRHRIIAMGRLCEEKQFSLLIEVFASLAESWPQWDLVIFGDGPLRGPLEDQLSQTGLRGRIKLAGPTTAPWHEMAQSDVFVMTSRIEGFPNALLEAMALSMPCAVFDCLSGPREITRDGIDALLIPLNDRERLGAALSQLMSDADFRLALGVRARASVVARYSLPAVVEVWDQLFEQVRSEELSLRPKQHEVRA
jgi:glycosyltransferase involved in cell wall biosynthesis